MVGQVGLVTIADVEKVAEHLDAVTLAARAEQIGDGQRQVLPQQIQQRRFEGGDRVNRRALVEGL